MNTPAHVAINLLCLGRQDQATVITPVMIGAILPDAPMFIFYFVEKVIRRMPEGYIWSQAYYQPHWQNFIDLFNSLPFLIVGLLFCGWKHSEIGMLLFSSMILHVAGDLPLHHEDAHRHFFPFSNWRFHSPLSYWDPKHYGNVVGVLEILAVMISCAILLQRYQTLGGKLCIGLLGMLYVSFFIYVLTVWAGHSD